MGLAEASVESLVVAGWAVAWVVVGSVAGSAAGRAAVDSEAGLVAGMEVGVAGGNFPVDAAAVHAGLDENAHVTLHDYEGLDHGFAAEDGVRRDEAAAQLADGRTEAFFAAHLG